MTIMTVGRRFTSSDALGSSVISSFKPQVKVKKRRKMENLAMVNNHLEKSDVDSNIFT